MRSRRNFITPSLFYFGVSGLIAITLLRLITSFMANPIIDYICYLDCTMALLKGLDCYEISNLFLHEWDGPLIIYPGMTLYFIPWTFISVKISSVIYYALTISVTVVNFVLIFKITGLLRQIKFKQPDKYTCLFFLSGFLFINSSPVTLYACPNAALLPAAPMKALAVSSLYEATQIDVPSPCIIIGFPFFMRSR